MKTIAVFGGAFDPIHIDHIKMAQIAKECSEIDEVWWLPSPDIRWDKQTQFKASQRVEFINKSISGITGMKVCLDEIEFGEYRGAYFLLNHLKNKYSENRFVMLIGADSYESLPIWRDPKLFSGENFNGPDLLKEFSILCCPRIGELTELNSKLHYEKYGQELIVPTKSLIERWGLAESSSTAIRESLKKGELSEYIPEAIRNYFKS